MLRISRCSFCYYSARSLYQLRTRQSYRKWFSLIIRAKHDNSNLSALFHPVPVKSNPDDINVGAELCGSLKKNNLINVLNEFYQKPEIKAILIENGLDSK